MRNPHDPDALSRALAEPSRRALLENLRLGQKTVTELVQATQLKQPNVSNHLAKMRQQNLVHAERNGRQVYYSIALPIADLLLRLHEFTTDPLQNEPVFDEPDQENADHAAVSSLPSSAGTTLPEPLAPSEEWALLREYRNLYFQSILSGQEDRALLLVNAMLARRIALVTVYGEIFQWALTRVGEWYEQGKTDEAHEHLASAITERMMAKVAQFYTPIHRMGYRAVLGCVADNWHFMGLRMLSDSLKELGWETVFLGANVPTDSFLAMVDAMHPDLVVVSCAMEDQEKELQHLLSRFKAHQPHAEPSYRIAVGGSYLVAHPERLHALPHDFSALNLADFLEAVQRHFPLPSRTHG